MMGQSYPIYACTVVNQARHFIGSHYILKLLGAKVFNIKKS